MTDPQKQKTSDGYEIPVPKRGEFIANLKKAAKPQPEYEAEDSTTDDSEKE